MTEAICFPQTRMFLSCIFTLTNCYLCFNSQIKRSSLIPQTFSESRFLDSSNWVSLVAQRLKRLPGMRETRVRSLGWEDPLEKEMATHSSALAWRIPWREEPGRACRQDWSQRVRHNWAASLSLFLKTSFPGSSEVKVSAWNAEDPRSIPGLGRSPGEGNGNPLQYSCLENPIKGRA